MYIIRILNFGNLIYLYINIILQSHKKFVFIHVYIWFGKVNTFITLYYYWYNTHAVTVENISNEKFTEAKIYIVIGNIKQIMSFFIRIHKYTVTIISVFIWIHSPFNLNSLLKYLI